MALVRRGNKQYLIESIRRGDRVTSRCVASGERAVELDAAYKKLGRSHPTPSDPARYLAWINNQVARELRQEDRRARRKYRKQFLRAKGRRETIEAKIRPLVAEVKTLVSGVMNAAGFHRQGVHVDLRGVASRSQFIRARSSCQNRKVDPMCSFASLIA